MHHFVLSSHGRGFQGKRIKQPLVSSRDGQKCRVILLPHVDAMPQVFCFLLLPRNFSIPVDGHRTSGLLQEWRRRSANIAAMLAVFCVLLRAERGRDLRVKRPRHKNIRFTGC